MNQQEIRDAIEELHLGENAWGHGYVFPLTQRTVDLAITALKAQIEPGWIKVDQLDADEPEKVLLCCFSDGSRETFYTDEIDNWNHHDTSFPKITHFRYLPEPPKEDEE